MVQGGVNPDLAIQYYVELFQRIGEQFPGVDIHSLSTSEICGIAKRENMSVEDVLATLRAAGLKSLPGAGAEIFVERVRKRISARKINDDRWLEVMRVAQRLGMPTTATMMFGSVETEAERITHLEVLRRTAGRDQRVLGVHPLVLRAVQDAAQGREATGIEYLRVIAISRLYLDNFPHVQSSWLTPGLKLGQLALLHGADDMGGTILEERVVTLAGSTNHATARISSALFGKLVTCRSSATRISSAAITRSQPRRNVSARRYGRTQADFRAEAAAANSGGSP